MKTEILEDKYTRCPRDLGPEKDDVYDDYDDDDDGGGGNSSRALAKCARVDEGAGEGDEMK